MAEKLINFNKAGENDGLEYSKSDIVKLCRINDNYAFSFYQYDYQAFSTKLAKNANENTDYSDSLIPVGKIVLSKATYDILKAEMQKLDENILKQSK